MCDSRIVVMGEDNANPILVQIECNGPTDDQPINQIWNKWTISVAKKAYSNLGCFVKNDFPRV